MSRAQARNDMDASRAVHKGTMTVPPYAGSGGPRGLPMSCEDAGGRRSVPKGERAKTAVGAKEREAVSHLLPDCGIIAAGGGGRGGGRKGARETY